MSRNMILNRKNSSRFKAQRMQGLISVIINILLFVAKYWAGILTGSIAIIADAWHTLSDSVSSLAVILSAKLSSRPADKDHPFGHGRVELIISLFIAALLFLVAYGFIREAVERLSSRQVVTYGNMAIIVTVISVIVKELLAQYSLRLGKAVDSEVLKADGWHHRSDAVSSVVILAGIFANRFIWWIDSALAAVVAIMIAYAASRIVSKTISCLLGEPLKPEIKAKILEIGRKAGGEAGDFHHFHYHNYVSHSELTFHMRLPSDMSIANGHAIADRIENEIRDALGIETTIHIEPLTN